MPIGQRKDEPLEIRVLRFIRDNRLVDEGTTLLVAVSGGPDSVFLLHTLFNLKDILRVNLHVAHLDHMLRGLDSKADARYVKRLAARLGLPSTIEARDVKSYRARRRISLEEAAREVRYEFLAEVAESIDAAAIAVGHTRDDNVETILMHLVRGTGTGGLRGLQPAVLLNPSGKTAAIIRPLLELGREETTGYCLEHGLEPRLDQTNRSMSLFRNRIRLELLPRLRRYNPRVDEALLRTAKIVADELAFLEKEASNLWNRVVEERDGEIVLDKQGLAAAPEALKRQLLRMSLEELIGNLKDIETRHIEELLQVLDKPAGTTVSLPGGIVFAVEYARYLLGSDAAALSPFPPLETEFRLNIPGETIASGWRVIATVFSGENQPRVSPFEKGGPRGISAPSLSACLDLDMVGNHFSVRPSRPGDRFSPLGLGAEKKVGEFMVDAKVPRSWRKRVPIVTSTAGVAWVVGYRIDERTKVTNNTRRVLRLEFERT